MSVQVAIRGIIFDLGDVLFTWSPNTATTISAKTLREILSTSTWFEYECGHLGQNACYEQIAREFSIEASEIAQAFAQARESLRPDDRVVALLKDLKKRTSISVFVMSNMSREDFAAVSPKMDWSLFDRIYTSGAVGIRKPDSDFFCHVLKEIKLAPEQVIFVDDKSENVLAAELLGIRAMLFDNSTIDTLQNLLDSPIARGCEYLYRNAKQFDSVTDNGIVVKDNFSQLLILEATRDQTLVSLKSNIQGTWNYFAGEATLIPGRYFPDDLDTTALALVIVGMGNPVDIASMLDKMAEYVNPDGTVLAYFDLEKLRSGDSVVAANVLAAFYRFNRGHQLPHTLQHIHDTLLHRTYINGTRYYPSADCCLGFFTRLIHSAAKDNRLETIGPLLKMRLQERVGENGDALDLAMRVLACDSLGIECKADRDALFHLQCQDGGWELGWLCRYGSTGVKIGNRGVTTALAMKAIAFSPSTPKIAASL